MAESTKSLLEHQLIPSNHLECAVCLQNCVHPAQLPCGHIFCFLCVKGIANQSKRCAMCRQEIPSDFLEHPKLLENPNELKETGEEFEGGYQWFYEGRNGWWQYDERTSRELEIAYKAGERTCELLIAGFLYIADFDSMVQRRRNDPARRRRIKRDLSTTPKKGIAGLKFLEDQSTPQQERSESPAIPVSVNCPTPPVTPSEIPHTPVEPHNSNNNTTIESLQSTIEQMQALTLTPRSYEDSESDEDTNSGPLHPRRYFTYHRYKSNEL